ncbi:MAG: FAD-dependent tricarballylate dehydrogenase TcuA [Hyphomicrobiaceae bacterium]|nr:FAD-dependent tricarballylate dehydrogenase TcuA [Hyphomicrobiaceae bacterium]
MQEPDADLLVVGGGIAGLAAAVSARQAGASVILLERAAREDRGGNTRWTEAFMRMRSEDEVAHDFISHFTANSGYHLDPALVAETAADLDQRSAIGRTLPMTDPDVLATFADAAGPTIGWLKSFGVRFDFLPSYLITTSTTRLAPIGGGLALVEALGNWAETNGVDVRYQTTARGLIQDASGAVVGIKAISGGSGGLGDIRARSVVLASGGFEGNPEMQARYLGPQSRYLRPVARGGYYNKGEGIAMALGIGAAPAGDYTLFHAEPLDPRSGAAEPIVLVFNYGILVNRDGDRFIDEAPATVDATYEAITRVILQQPGGIAYTVLDARIEDVPGWQRSVRSDEPPVRAATLEGLARALGIDPTRLAATVAAYNVACPGEAGFKPLEVDGLITHAGYAPRKSNWARRIDRGPFLAYPIMCGNCFTFGGLKVDTSARVLDTSGVVIPGLYAAGETMGLYYGTYTGATSVLRGAVFGRIAGRHAASAAGHRGEQVR